MPKISDARRAARRDEILDAALRVFVAHGYGGASMSKIVAESGLSAGAIYVYFEGKQELFRALAERGMLGKQAQPPTDPYGPPRSPAEIVRLMVTGMEGSLLPGLAPQVWAEATVTPEIREIMTEVFSRLRAAFAGELERWARADPSRVDGDPAQWATRAAPVLIASMPGFILQRALIEDFDEQAFVDALPLVLRD